MTDYLNHDIFQNLLEAASLHQAKLRATNDDSAIAASTERIKAELQRCLHGKSQDERCEQCEIDAASEPAHMADGMRYVATSVYEGHAFSCVCGELFIHRNDLQMHFSEALGLRP